MPTILNLNEDNVALLIKALITVKILKIGTHKIITVTVLQLKQLDFTVQ